VPRLQPLHGLFVWRHRFRVVHAVRATLALMERILVADRGDAGVRLDLMLRRHLAGTGAATRTQVQQWIADGRVRINDRVVQRVSARTMAGDVVAVALPADAVPLVMAPEALPIDIVHEDDVMVIVNKPAGLVVHPTYGHQTATLMNGLLWRARQWPDGSMPSIVGRLDKQTSGLVVVAKSPAVHAALQAIMASHASRKEYLAIVFGRLPGEPIVIDLKLARDPDDRRRVVSSPARGVPARTEVSRLDERELDGQWVSAVRCRLFTGRMHQIRVHLAASGWPIAGDAKYGRPLPGLTRQALHAWQISFAHPATGAIVAAAAPLHDDLRALVAGFPRLSALCADG
jgi:23S rRNA pseudouridine1911/1915/1917 synthase